MAGPGFLALSACGRTPSPKTRPGVRLTSMAALVSLLLAGCASQTSIKPDQENPNGSGPIAGTRFPGRYDPHQLGTLYKNRHKTELKMFDLINEAALRRDRSLRPKLDLYRDSLGYIPSLAHRHYRYVFGDTSQLDWLLAEDAKRGLGRDSLIVTIFGYMDEWDKTIRRFKQHQEVADGAGAEVLHAAIQKRKQIYGSDRFEDAWNRIR